MRARNSLESCDCCLHRHEVETRQQMPVIGGPSSASPHDRKQFFVFKFQNSLFSVQMSAWRAHQGRRMLPAPRLLPRNARPAPRQACLALLACMLLARILTPVLMQRAGIGDNAASANHDNEPYAVNIQTNGRPSLRIFLPPGFRQVIRFANVDGKVFAYHAGTPCVFAAVYVKERMELCNCGGIEL